jgi:hypothetical protein
MSKKKIDEKLKGVGFLTKARSNFDKTVINFVDKQIKKIEEITEDSFE